MSTGPDSWTPIRKVRWRKTIYVAAVYVSNLTFGESDDVLFVATATDAWTPRPEQVYKIENRRDRDDTTGQETGAACGRLGNGQSQRNELTLEARRSCAPAASAMGNARAER